MEKQVELSKIRYHWALYVARGGIDKPRKCDNIGHLRPGGLVHWTMFLRKAKSYLAKHPKDRHLIEEFVPQKLVMLLVGEG